jgi:hypothetical protein
MLDKSEAPARRGYLATPHASAPATVGGSVPTVPSSKLDGGGWYRLKPLGICCINLKEKFRISLPRLPRATSLPGSPAKR